MFIFQSRQILVGLVIIAFITSCTSYVTPASFISGEMNSNTLKVTSIAQFEKVMPELVPGDTVVLADGVWSDFQITLTGEGTAEKPITIRAETPGQVILSGQSNLRLSGQHLIVSGLYFKDGYSPTRSVISFNTGKQRFAYHSRVTQTTIENYNENEKFGSVYWVELNGQHNRFDHNALVGKKTSGVTMAVRLNHPMSQENYHQIDHNYFGYRQTLGSNGGETLRIGTSHYSLTDSFTTVSHNYFDQTNGEVEIISVKSGNNILKHNTFYASRGTLTLRHGNGNEVSENVFFGNGVEHTGGIRVINADQTITNNYLEGLKGYRFGSGFTVMNGVPNSKINRYHQVKNANISNNTFINVDHLHFGAGSDAERSARPVDSRFENNLIIADNQRDGITLFDDMSGIAFANNLTNTKNHTIGSGFMHSPGSLVRAKNGLAYPSDTTVTSGIRRGLEVTTPEQTGPDWYEKPNSITPFASGQTIPAQDTKALLAVLQRANDGDIITLTGSEYVITQSIVIDKTVSIIGQGTPLITFDRNNLFTLADGGSLHLENIHISGLDAPDSAGNVLIRNTRLPTLNNYRLRLANVRITDLDVNHSFHVFDAGYRSFADDITIVDSQFNNITGDILRLDKERDDLGIYNAEYITLTDNTFTDIQGNIMNVYRGGTDESTFGPHVEFNRNTLANVGFGKRNKADAVIRLHGVQVTHIANNRFTNTRAIVIEHTVGEPITRIEDNTFNNVPSIEVSELFTQGPSTAITTNNRFN